MTIRSLQLGTKTFHTNIIQGPLAGVSCAPFRRLTWQHSQPAFSCTEMISASTLIHRPKFSQRRFVFKDPKEGPVCFQLAASEPKELGEAVKIADDAGADLIDLNCGCPVKKIRGKGAGSRLLTEFEKLAALIETMRKNTRLPISIKIRVEGKGPDRFHEELLKIIQNSGLDFLTVHGRHWTEHYETPCSHEAIQFFVENLNIPVIGNGDIACVDSLKKMFATGCAGVMIARAGVGQPWLIAKLSAEMQGEKFSTPSLEMRRAMFIEHISELSELLENETIAILQARKLAKYYARDFTHRARFCEEINTCESLVAFKRICAGAFISL